MRGVGVRYGSDAAVRDQAGRPRCRLTDRKHRQGARAPSHASSTRIGCVSRQQCVIVLKSIFYKSSFLMHFQEVFSYYARFSGPKRVAVSLFVIPINQSRLDAMVSFALQSLEQPAVIRVQSISTNRLFLMHLVDLMNRESQTGFFHSKRAVYSGRFAFAIFYQPIIDLVY